MRRAGMLVLGLAAALSAIAVALGAGGVSCRRPEAMDTSGSGSGGGTPGVVATSGGGGTPGAGATSGGGRSPGSGGGATTAGADTNPGPVRFRIETVAENLQVPWSIAFAPDGRIFFTERPGRVRVIENGRLNPAPVASIETAVAGEGGLMGLALHPDFEKNHWLYLAWMYEDGSRRGVRVVRYREENGRLVDPLTLIEGIPAVQFHAGCRIRFGPDGKLYITTGDATQRDLAQDLSSLAGKTLRLNDDGSVPSDNPFVGKAGARPQIWSYGHRNSQGLDWQPGTGLLFETEHGPSGFDGPGGGDEVNIVEAGKNYGWPVIHHRQTHAGMESPIAEYTPAIAPSGATFYRGSLFPAFKDNFFFTGLRGEVLMRIVLDGRRIVRQERLLSHVYGRLRDVVEGPDGALYIATSNRDGRGSPAPNDDRILKLVPGE